MLNRRSTIVVTGLVAALATGLLGGCARPAAPEPRPGTPAGTGPALDTPTSASSSASPSASASGGAGTGGGLPTPPPPPPPRTPSDATESGWLVGTVTVGGSGPCYGMETDDGQPIALHGDVGALTRGQRIRVQVQPYAGTLACAPGQRQQILKLERPG